MLTRLRKPRTEPLRCSSRPLTLPCLSSPSLWYGILAGTGWGRPTSSGHHPLVPSAYDGAVIAGVKDKSLRDGPAAGADSDYVRTNQARVHEHTSDDGHPQGRCVGCGRR